MDNTDCSQLVESNPNTVVHAAVCPWGKEGNPGAGGLDGTPGTQGLISTPLTRVDVSAMPQVHKGALALTEVNDRASFPVDVERGPALHAQQASPAIHATSNSPKALYPHQKPISHSAVQASKPSPQ